MDREFTLEIVRVTEFAAIAAAKLRGKGDEKLADQAAVDAYAIAIELNKNVWYRCHWRRRKRRGPNVIYWRESWRG